jgi:uncharacterized protein (DUF1330 family)
MPAYLIVAGSINDPHKWATYRGAVLPLIQQFGGIHLTGGGGAELLEGTKSTIAIFEFPSMSELHAFWESPEYASIKELRRGVADLNIWAVPSSPHGPELLPL